MRQPEATVETEYWSGESGRIEKIFYAFGKLGAPDV